MRWRTSTITAILLDGEISTDSFDPAHPAYFVYYGLLRIMAIEAKSLTKGDGLDFCHAVMGCAFANFHNARHDLEASNRPVFRNRTGLPAFTLVQS